MDSAVEKVEDNKLMGSVNTNKEVALALVIENQQGLEKASHNLSVIKVLKKQVTDTFGPIKDKAYAVHQEACAQERKHLDPLKEAEKIIKVKVADYMDIEEKKRLEEQKKLEAERATAQAAKLKRINASIEKLNEKSGDLKGQLSTLETELESCQDEDEAVALRSAIQGKRAELDAMNAKAEEKAAVAEEVVSTPAPVAVTAPIKVKGISSTVKKTGEVVNKKALLMAVANDKMGILPMDLFDVNQSKLNKLVSTGVTLPGVKVITDRGIASR